MQENLEKEKRKIRSVLIANGKSGIRLKYFAKEFEELQDKPPQYKEFGFNSVYDLLRACPDAAWIGPDPEYPGEGRVYMVADKDTAHILNMQMNTRIKPKKRKRNLCRGIGYAPKAYQGYRRPGAMVPFGRPMLKQKPAQGPLSITVSSTLKRSVVVKATAPAIATVPKTYTKLSGMEMERVTAILKTCPFGALNSVVEKEYKSTHKRELPGNWVEQMSGFINVVKDYGGGMLKLAVLQKETGSDTNTSPSSMPVNLQQNTSKKTASSERMSSSLDEGCFMGTDSPVKTCQEAGGDKAGSTQSSRENRLKTLQSLELKKLGDQTSSCYSSSIFSDSDWTSDDEYEEDEWSQSADQHLAPVRPSPEPKCAPSHNTEPKCAPSHNTEPKCAPSHNTAPKAMTPLQSSPNTMFPMPHAPSTRAPMSSATILPALRSFSSTSGTQLSSTPTANAPTPVFLSTPIREPVMHAPRANVHLRNNSNFRAPPPLWRQWVRVPVTGKVGGAVKPPIMRIPAQTRLIERRMERRKFQTHLIERRMERLKLTCPPGILGRPSRFDDGVSDFGDGVNDSDWDSEIDVAEETEDIGNNRPVCICEREQALVYCTACHSVQPNSRVRTRCEAHPRVYKDRDLLYCPDCNSDQIIVLEKSYAA